MTTADDTTVSAHSKVQRRTIVKGAAWTVPVVAMGVAAPAASASTEPPEAVRLGVFGSSGTISQNFKFTVEGIDAEGDEGAEFPEGTTLTFPAEFTASSIENGGVVVQEGPLIVQFPAGVIGVVRGKFTATGDYTINASGPGVTGASTTITVS